MDMETKADIVVDKFPGSFNCAQTTLMMFAEDYDIDEATALRIGAGLGGGCHFGEICGAASAGAAVVGMKYGHTKPDPEQYAICREKTKEFIEMFKEENGAVSCRDLLGVDMAEPGGRERAIELDLFNTRCKGFVRSAVEILEDLGY